MLFWIMMFLLWLADRLDGISIGGSGGGKVTKSTTVLMTCPRCGVQERLYTWVLENGTSTDVCLGCWGALLDRT